MKIYLAPLENNTTIEYRNTLHELFPESVDTYFMPFFMPHIKISLDEKDRRQLDRKKNEVEHLVPQIITDDANDFWRMAKGILDLGYEEINLNIGCPSKRVASKGRGAGLLGRREHLDHFLQEIFAQDHKAQISVKTRLGMKDPEEFYALLEIYNKYPLKELIIHARTGIQKYGGSTQKEYFLYALKQSKNPLCYNGDIYTLEDYRTFLAMVKQAFPENPDMMDSMPGIMIGRGLLANPALGREIKGGKALSGQEMLTFMDRYRERMRQTPRKKQEYFLMNKSKEMLGFMRGLYRHRLDEMNQMLLCEDYERYLRLEQTFFENCESTV